MDKYHIESAGDFCSDDHLCRCPRCRPYCQDDYEYAQAKQTGNEESYLEQLHREAHEIDEAMLEWEIPEQPDSEDLTDMCGRCGTVFFINEGHECLADEQADDGEPERENPYMYKVEELVREANKSQEYWDLGGCEGPSPLSDLVDALVSGGQQAAYLWKHQHEWSRETGYCMVCGRDGNA